MMEPPSPPPPPPPPTTPKSGQSRSEGKKRLKNLSALRRLQATIELVEMNASRGALDEEEAFDWDELEISGPKPFKTYWDNEPPPFLYQDEARQLCESKSLLETFTLPPEIEPILPSPSPQQRKLDLDSKPKQDPKPKPPVDPNPKPKQDPDPTRYLDIKPNLDPKLKVVVEPKLGPKPKLVPNPKLDPKPKLVPNPKLDPKPKLVPNPKLDPKPKFVPNPKMDPKPKAMLDPKPKPNLNPKATNRNPTLVPRPPNSTKTTTRTEVKGRAADLDDSLLPPKNVYPRLLPTKRPIIRTMADIPDSFSYCVQSRANFEPPPKMSRYEEEQCEATLNVMRHVFKIRSSFEKINMEY